VFGSDGTLVTVSHDTRAGAQIWRRDADGAYVQELSMPGSIGRELPAFSADGSTVAIPTGSGVMVARRDGGATASDEKWRAVQTLIPENSISSIAVLSDGRGVVTLGKSGITKVWSERADGGWSSTQITADDSNIAVLNLMPDGRSLILDDGEASVKADLSVFVTPRADLVAAACAGALGGGEFADSTGKGPIVGLRLITAGDVAAAPILRGREGEDVCAWKPGWLDRWLDMALGWLN
jgi:Tol biopolymer transport system component